jgi:hypothetical protein
MVMVMPAGTLRAAGNLQRGQQPTLEAMLASHMSDVPRTCPPEQACSSSQPMHQDGLGQPLLCATALHLCSRISS